MAFVQIRHKNTNKHVKLLISHLIIHLFVRSITADEGLDMKHLRSSRRSRLPAPRPDTGDFSLWGLLRKNIGKDLSKISMPVSLNEPLSMLQVLYTHTCQRAMPVHMFKISTHVSLCDLLSTLQVLHTPVHDLHACVFE